MIFSPVLKIKFLSTESLCILLDVNKIVLELRMVLKSLFPQAIDRLARLCNQPSDAGPESLALLMG